MDEIPEGWNQELYEKLSFDFLIACAENMRIDEWNALYQEYLESERKRVYSKKEWDMKDLLDLLNLFSRLKKPDFVKKDFQNAISRGVSFAGLHLEGADLNGANLVGADLEVAHLVGANLVGADLEVAHLVGANLVGADLEVAHLVGAHLEGANFSRAHLEGADLSWAVVNEITLFRDVKIDDATGSLLSRIRDCKNENGDSILVKLPKILCKKKGTDFSNVALGTCRIDTLTKTRIEKNIRVYRWNDWYKNHKFLQIIMRPFWFLTDYGASTIRPVCAFILWNTIFSIIYFVWVGNDFNELMIPYTSPFFPNMGNNSVIFLTDWMKSNLMVISLTDMATIEVGPWTIFVVFLHVFVGYFILAALIARLSIMFQNLSPNDE